MKQFTPNTIETLNENEVFVFGSNLNGNHAGGAARLAVEKFRAIQGQARGLQGQSYAIPTLDENMQKVSLNSIKDELQVLIDFANANQSLTFFVTKIGCGIAGFEEKEIADIFKGLTIPENVIIPMEFATIKGVKGFDKNLQCRGFQFEFNKDYKHKGEVKVCNGGFHFCENPLDVIGYYPPAESRFAQVEGNGDISTDTNDSKVAVSSLSIKGELSLHNLIGLGVKFIFNRVKWETAKESNTGYRSAATNTGDQSAATNTGNYSAATNTGYRSAATNTGYQSAATVESKDSIAIVTGYQSKAKGKIGCWLVLTERDDNYTILSVKSFKVDGKRILEDVFYTLENGKAKRVE